MTLSRTRLLAYAVGALASLLLSMAIAYLIGKGCAVTPAPPIERGIDAGPGERVIAAELDAAVRREQERLDALIAEQQGELARLRGEDAASFEAAKRRGRQALAEWFAARMPRDGGV